MSAANTTGGEDGNHSFQIQALSSSTKERPETYLLVLTWQSRGLTYRKKEGIVRKTDVHSCQKRPERKSTGGLDLRKEAYSRM